MQQLLPSVNPKGHRRFTNIQAYGRLVQVWALTLHSVQLDIWQSFCHEHRDISDKHHQPSSVSLEGHQLLKLCSHLAYQGRTLSVKHQDVQISKCSILQQKMAAVLHELIFPTNFLCTVKICDIK